MLTALAFSLIAPVAQETDLGRVFKAGEKQEYAVASHLQVETRAPSQGLMTFIPEDLDIKYRFTLDVKAIKGDGIADLRYQRPTVTEVQGETTDRGPVTNVEKVNYDMQMQVSPVNEILDVKDLTKKVPPKKGGGRWMTPLGVSDSAYQDLGGFVSEVYRLSLFAGSFDSALDFAPKLPLFAVKVGETWKKTVGYSPQSLKGKTGKSAVQRLDYTYTYKGVMTVNNVKVHRIEATLDLKTDLAKFLADSTGLSADETGLKEWPLALKAQIDFDLDLATRNTIRASAKSEGGFKIVATAMPDIPVQEQKIRGETMMRRIK